MDQSQPGRRAQKNGLSKTVKNQGGEPSQGVSMSVNPSAVPPKWDPGRNKKRASPAKKTIHVPRGTGISALSCPGRFLVASGLAHTLSCANLPPLESFACRGATGKGDKGHLGDDGALLNPGENEKQPREREQYILGAIVDHQTSREAVLNKA